MRFLCVSDVHGHASALRQVIEHGRVMGFDQLICCGDLLFPGPEPLETWKLLTQHKALCVQGLTDAAVARVDPGSFTPTNDEQRQRLERLNDLHDELGELIVARLLRLKPIARLPLESGHELVVVHGSPTDPTEPMSFDMDDDELNALLGADPADIVVCGASHVPFERQIGDTRIVNVGSVGESPTPGVAYGAFIESVALGVQIESFSIDLV